MHGFGDKPILSTLYAPSQPALLLSLAMSGRSYLTEAVDIPPGAKPRKGISGKLLTQDDILTQSTIMSAFNVQAVRANMDAGFIHFETRPIKDSKPLSAPFYSTEAYSYCLFAATHALMVANNASPYGRPIGYGSPSTPRSKSGPATAQIHPSLAGEAQSTFKLYPLRKISKADRRLPQF
jgi:hypothetical protein